MWLQKLRGVQPRRPPRGKSLGPWDSAGSLDVPDADSWPALNQGIGIPGEMYILTAWPSVP